VSLGQQPGGDLCGALRCGRQRVSLQGQTNDRRARYAALTAAGHELVGEIFPEHVAALTRAVGVIVLRPQTSPSVRIPRARVLTSHMIPFEQLTAEERIALMIGSVLRSRLI